MARNGSSLLGHLAWRLSTSSSDLDVPVFLQGRLFLKHPEFFNRPGNHFIFPFEILQALLRVEKIRMKLHVDEDAVDFFGVAFIHLPQGVPQYLNDVLRCLLRGAYGIIHGKSDRIAQLLEGLDVRIDLRPFKIGNR